MTTDTTRCADCSNAIPDPVQQFGDHRKPTCAHCWYRYDVHPEQGYYETPGGFHDPDYDRDTMRLDWSAK